MQPAIKRSKQRDAIVAFLMNRKDHPTADIIYMNIKKEFPNISLGTVYRNLALLSERGEILKISYEDGADRYDAQTKPHYHFIFKKCGAVIDVEMESIERQIKELVDEKFSGQIDECVTYFKGICEKCQN